MIILLWVALTLVALVGLVLWIGMKEYACAIITWLLGISLLLQAIQKGVL